MDRVNFTFSDLVAGYVQSFDAATDSYVVKTPGGNEVAVTIGANCYAEMVRNLGEGYQDAGDMRALSSRWTPLDCSVEDELRSCRASWSNPYLRSCGRLTRRSLR